MTHATPYTTPAASECAALTTGGRTDWFLPSRNELNELAQIRGQYGIPNSGWFWSSSQFDSYGAWDQHFRIGGQGVYGKLNGNYVRAIRAF
jgi:hypothetical protein